MMRIRFCALTFGLICMLSILPGAFATPWSDLEPGTIQVETLSMRLFPCPRAFADKRAALQILGERYGLEMNPNCEITLYVEMKDFYRESLFEAPPR
jgi:hypothetical protein